VRRKWGIGYCSEYNEDYKVLYKRLTFPIWDWRGRLVSFSGRTLKGADYTGPKYLSLPDTATFHKSEQLYGINWAIPLIAKSRIAVVVEGYTDVIGLHDLSGVRNAVGSMGVAVTLKQVRLLARWAKLVILVLDGDNAGNRATAKLLEKLKESPVEIGYVYLREGKDPFDLSLQDGPLFGEFIKDNFQGPRRLLKKF
jgi:DNA primase